MGDLCKLMQRLIVIITERFGIRIACLARSLLQAK